MAVCSTLCALSPSTAKLSTEQANRQRVKLMGTFTCGFKNTIAAVTLSSFIAGSGGAAISPAVSDTEPRIKASVDRTHKGDRLQQAAMRHHQSLNNSSSTETTTTSPKRAPLGCDSAFSPISAPSLAHIFKRCIA
jgi:hypothetical protein